MSVFAARIALILLSAACASAQTAGLELDGVQQHAASLFDPAVFSAPESALRTACDHLLLMAQAVSVTLIVAAMISKMRKQQVQMEGIATVMLQVAFIAIVPLLRVQVVEIGDSIAEALEYKSASASAHGGSGSSAAWALLQQWAPPGSPLLDALQTQSAEPPVSGHEDEWTLAAWNWAKGVGSTTASVLDAQWQAISGAVRAGLLFVGCTVLACLLSFAIFTTYAVELLRHVLIYGGCAVLPIFIGGLGLDAFRGPCVRFILLLSSVAAWPIAWALANIVSEALATGLDAWMRDVVGTALAIPGGDATPPLATAAPFVAWAMLVLFAGATIVVGAWVLLAAAGVPYALSRLVRSGAGFAVSITAPVSAPEATRVAITPPKPILVPVTKAAAAALVPGAAHFVRPVPEHVANSVAHYATATPRMSSNLERWWPRDGAASRRRL